LVIGPPGAGKTTFCNGMHQFLGALGRKSSVVNLDAANDHVSYPCAVNIFTLISLEDIMKHEGLGPNGGLMYALETLEENFEWLQEELAKLGGNIRSLCP
jgi:GTPase SAR1 family protein